MKYNVEDMLDMPWGEFFTTLAGMAKEVYEPNEKLVFELNSDVNHSLLTKFFKDFYKNIRILDIPNFFIHIYVPNKETKKFLPFAKKNQFI